MAEDELDGVCGLESLLARLYRARLELTPGQVLEGELLLRALMRDGGKSSELPPLLGVLWGRTPASQRRIELFISQCLEGIEPDIDLNGSALEEPLPETPEESAAAKKVDQDKEKKGRIRNLSVRAFLVGVAIFIGLAYASTRAVQTQFKNGANANQILFPGAFKWGALNVDSILKLANSVEIQQWLVIGVTSVLAILSVLGLGRLMQGIIRRKEAKKEIGQDLGVSSVGDPGLEKAGRDLAAALLWRRASLPSRVDAVATVKASLRKWPCVVVKKGQLKVTRSVTVLIESQSRRDSHAAMWEQLFAQADRKGIRCDVYKYSGAPHLLFREDHSHSVELNKLLPPDDQSDLIVIGDPRGMGEFLDMHEEVGRVTLNRWENRILLIPYSDPGGPVSKVDLGRFFTLAESTLSGLIKVLQEKPSPIYMDRLSDRVVNGRAPSSALKTLSAWLDKPAYSLLLASSVFPVLSAGFAKELATEPITPAGYWWSDAMFKLSSIKWFRQGYIPERFRAEMMETLAPSTIVATRSRIDDMWAKARLFQRGLMNVGFVQGRGKSETIRLGEDALTMEFMVRSKPTQFAATRVIYSAFERFEIGWRQRLIVMRTVHSLAVFAVLSLIVGLFLAKIQTILVALALVLVVSGLGFVVVKFVRAYGRALIVYFTKIPSRVSYVIFRLLRGGNIRPPRGSEIWGASVTMFGVSLIMMSFLLYMIGSQLYETVALMTVLTFLMNAVFFQARSTARLIDLMIGRFGLIPYGPDDLNEDELFVGADYDHRLKAEKKSKKSDIKEGDNE